MKRLINAATWIFLSSTLLYAIDGISVTGVWSGTNNNYYGGFGKVVRCDIKGSKVIKRTDLYKGTDARTPVLSNDGSMVAFLKKNGKVAVMSVTGGNAQDAATGHGEARCDWSGEWVYFTCGGYSQSGSNIIKRVNASTKKVETVVTLSRRTWSIHISEDGKKALIRSGKEGGKTQYDRAVFFYDLVKKGKLEDYPKLGGGSSYVCGVGLDPKGEYAMVGNYNHTGISIYKWSDRSKAGGEFTFGGLQHNRNAWSTNSQQWVCLLLGWGTRGANGCNQYLFNWKTKENITTTTHTNGSKDFACAGDFWVGNPDTYPVGGQVYAARNAPVPHYAANALSIWRDADGRHMRISSPDQIINGIRISDLSGKTLYQCSGNSVNTISVPKRFSTGSYIVKARCGSNEYLRVFTVAQ